VLFERFLVRLVLRVSRRRYFRKVYEMERFLVPIPAGRRGVDSPWLDRESHILHLSYGFAILVAIRERIYLDPCGGDPSLTTPEVRDTDEGDGDLGWSKGEVT